MVQGQQKTGLEICALKIWCGARRLVEMDHQISAGQITTVMGPSGAGKSTLLSALIGALAPEFCMQGRVILHGCDVTDAPIATRRIGILFQDDLLFPHLSVGGNLAFGLPACLRGRAVRQARVAQALEQAGLAGFADRDPATLSGGQRARVALMRTLLAEPQALLLDEPFSRLDSDLRAQVRGFVFDQARALGLPVMLVTHDAGDATAAQGPVLQLTSDA